MHEVVFNRLGGLSLPRKSVARLTDRPDMAVKQQHNNNNLIGWGRTGRGGGCWGEVFQIKRGYRVN